LTGGAGWKSLPVALSNGNGTFTTSNNLIGQFATFASEANVKVMARDLNGDGRTDVALTGGAGWKSLPVALSNGNGTFTTSNNAVGEFATFASEANVKVLTGDFNADGKADLALTGGAGWKSLPVALSNGNGTFTTSNNAVGEFATFAANPGVQVA
jgi:hypothetical protein